MQDNYQSQKINDCDPAIDASIGHAWATNATVARNDAVTRNAARYAPGNDVITRYAARYATRYAARNDAPRYARVDGYARIDGYATRNGKTILILLEFVNFYIPRGFGVLGFWGFGFRV